MYSPLTCSSETALGSRSVAAKSTASNAVMLALRTSS